MATLDDMLRLEQHIVGTCSLTWVVAGQPVVALFAKNHDAGREHLGHPSPHNQVSDCLRLWIGIDTQTGRVLVTLTHRIKVSTTPNSRLFFMVVPSESLVLDATAPAFWALTEEDIPSTLLETPSDEKSARVSRLLHMSLTLGKDKVKSHVIMPAQRYVGHVRPQSLTLLRKLKALSEVSCFDLYTNHNSWTQLGLSQTIQMLKKTTLTPSVDLTALYPGSRNASIDSWLEQGWRERDEDKTCEPLLRATKKRGRGNKMTLSKRRRFGSPQAGPLPPLLPPPYDLSMPAPLSLPAINAEAPCVPSRTSDVAETPIAPLEGPRADAADAVSHAAVTSPSFSGCRGIPPTPIPSHPGLDYESSCSYVPETPVERQRLGRPSSVPESIQPCANADAVNIPSLTVFDTRISLWLAHAWEVCPCAHYLFIAELLRLGAAAQDTDVARFHTCRVACMTALLAYCAKEELTSVSHEREPLHVAEPRTTDTTKFSPFRNEMPALISWLLHLDPMADLKMFSSLRRLTVLEYELLQSFQCPEDSGCSLALKRFTHLKAVVVAEACVVFGAQALERCHDIATIMMEEKNRLNVSRCSH